MSTSADRTGCRSLAWSRSRRTGVFGTAVRASRPTALAAAATTNAAAGEAAPTTSPATAGPIACWTVGRIIPSKPFTACRSVSGTSAGIQAVYAGQ